MKIQLFFVLSNFQIFLNYCFIHSNKKQKKLEQNKAFIFFFISFKYLKISKNVAKNFFKKKKNFCSIILLEILKFSYGSVLLNIISFFCPAICANMKSLIFKLQQNKASIEIRCVLMVQNKISSIHISS